LPKRRDYDSVAGPRAASQRQLRVGEEIRHLLAQLLRPGELRDPALREANITVTEARLSPDLRNATAYVMPLAGANVGEIMRGLRRSAPFLKARLARELDLRYVPNLVFALDNAFESAERIATLLASPAVERDLHPDPENGDDPG
jgi:ribosome-binding factor A